MLIRCRPKSSITSVPQLLFSCSGASLMPGRLILRHFQVVHRQFAADDDRRATDADPAPVDAVAVEQPFVDFSQWHFLVVDRVEQPHDFAVDADRARNPDRTRPKAARDPFGDARLAVAGMPNRNMPRPELIAGPIRLSIFSLINRSANAFRSSPLARSLIVSDWAATDSTYDVR